MPFSLFLLIIHAVRSFSHQPSLGSRSPRVHVQRSFPRRHTGIPDREEPRNFSKFLALRRRELVSPLGSVDGDQVLFILDLAMLGTALGTVLTLGVLVLLVMIRARRR